MCTYIISTRLLKGGYFGLRVGKEETTGELSRRGVMVNTVEESASIRNWPHQDIIKRSFFRLRPPCAREVKGGI